MCQYVYKGRRFFYMICDIEFDRWYWAQGRTNGFVQVGARKWIKTISDIYVAHVDDKTMCDSNLNRPWIQLNFLYWTSRCSPMLTLKDVDPNRVKNMKCPTPPFHCTHAFVLLGPCNTYCNIPISIFLKRDILLFDHNIPISRCPISIQFSNIPFLSKNIPYPNFSFPYPPFLKVTSQYPNLVLQGPVVISVLSAICARANQSFGEVLTSWNCKTIE